MDIYKNNQRQADDLVEELYESLKYLDYPTIRKVLIFGIHYAADKGFDYIGNPTDALNYQKEINNIIQYLNKKNQK